ncbi:hypothetical protein IJG72_02385 [bacterium]|nr:hypothetical protein [bacterium]
MKKFVIIIFTVFLLTLQCVMANIKPYNSSDIALDAIGMYQVPNYITVYKEPNEKSKVLYRANWSQKFFNCSLGDMEDIFTVYIANKNLALVQVVDYTDDWVKIIYDKSEHKTGWLKAEDIRFMTWRNFMNTYARRYGLYLFKDIPVENRILYSGITDNAQQLQSITGKPLKITLTAIKGNMILVTAIENNVGKTGFLKWRTDEGKIYVFPAIR